MGSYVGPVGSVGGTGLKAFGDVLQGEGQQAADQYQANELRTKAEYSGAAATETNATLTDRLATTLGNIDVIRAAGHADPTSPTTMALRGRAIAVSSQDRAIRVGNFMAQQQQDLTSATYLTSAGKFAMQMGYLNAATDVLNAGASTKPDLFGVGPATDTSVPLPGSLPLGQGGIGSA